MNCPICKLDIKQSTQICRADLLTRRWSCEYGINVDRLLGNVAEHECQLVGVRLHSTLVEDRPHIYTNQSEVG